MSQKRAEKSNKRNKRNAKAAVSRQTKFSPAYLRDDPELLTKTGFALSNTWYHGTSSLLLPSILDRGLNVSGDTELNLVVKHEMESHGLPYLESKEPIYLSPSKEVAHYWASRTSIARSRRFGGDDKPVVLEVTLPDDLNDLVSADIGGYQRIMGGADAFLPILKAKYKAKSIVLPSLKGNSAIINITGLANINTAIPVDCILVIDRP